MEKLQAANDEFNEVQRKISEQISARQTLEMQLQENKIVSEELESTTDSSKVYKLMGQVLVPQDASEAQTNVNKRLEFIQGEIKKVEKQIAESQAKMEKKRAEVIEIRAQLMSAQPQQPQGPPGTAQATV